MKLALVLGPAIREKKRKEREERAAVLAKRAEEKRKAELESMGFKPLKGGR